MANRMNKYYGESEPLGKRTEKNQELYQSINKSQIEDYNVNSNISVLDDELGNEINVDKIKEILSTRLEKPIQRRSITLEPETEKEEVPLETKDYDLNSILMQAKAEKPVNYTEERLKNIRNTQYDILKQIDISRKNDEPKNNAEEELMTMIKTITEKEYRANIENACDEESDLFSNLKGTGNTEVLPPITDADIVNYQVKTNLDDELDNSFYTDSLKVKPNDMEDFEELREEITSNSISIKVLIILFIIIVLFGLVFLFDKIFTWGIF